MGVGAVELDFSYKQQIYIFGKSHFFMTVERTNNEVIIKLPASVDVEDLQDFINYVRYKELTSDFSIDQQEVDQLAKDINTNWWAENRSNLIK